MPNPGKLIQKFFRNFSFPGIDRDRRLENPSSIFSKFQFPGHELDQFLENSSISFLRTYSVFVRYGGISLTNLWKTVHIMDCAWKCPYKLSLEIWSPYYGLCHARKSLNIIYRLNPLFWMTFPKIGLAHRASYPNLNKTELILVG